MSESNFFELASKIILTIGLAIVAHKFLGGFTAGIVKRNLSRHVDESNTEHKKRSDTLGNFFGTAVGLVIWLIALGIILAILDFNLASVATGAGFLGIIIGIGAQATIRDYLAGIFILLENQYRVGDIVTLSGGSTGGVGTSGVVEQITLRITKLRDLDGTLNVVRNGEASIITNRTFNYSSVVIDVGVGYDSDIDKVETVMNEVGQLMLEDAEIGKDINEPITFLRVNDFADSAIMIKAVGKVKPAKQWTVAGEYRRRLLKAFTKSKIEIAFPQLVIHDQRNKTR